MIRFFIYLLIGTLIIPLYNIYPVRSWEILPSQWDLRRLSNHAPYLVEGKGGLSMILGQDEPALRLRWGSPDYRDFAAPELLVYHRTTFSGEFLLYNGRIVEIRYIVNRNTAESLRWFTAMGLYADDLQSLSEDDQKKKILDMYNNPKYHISIDGLLDVFSRGIRFRFKNGKIHKVEIFNPRYRY